MYAVRVYVDPFSNDEMPLMVFRKYPSKEQVWEELKKEHFYEVNKSEAPDSEDWDWGFDVEEIEVIENGDEDEQGS